MTCSHGVSRQIKSVKLSVLVHLSLIHIYTVAKVKDADVVIFAGGISPSLEGEEMGVNLPGFRTGDRTDIELPAAVSYTHL